MFWRACWLRGSQNFKNISLPWRSCFTKAGASKIVVFLRKYVFFESLILKGICVATEILDSVRPELQQHLKNIGFPKDMCVC